MSWQIGAMLTMGIFVLVAVAAQILDEDRRERRKRRDVRRAAQLARGRERMAAEHDEAAHMQRISDAADVAERAGYRWPDVEKLT